jgi:uncharacterized protein DUF6979
MGKYGQTALLATKLIINNHCLPEKAWLNAVKQICMTESSQAKNCPKSAFLGLCEDGIITDISKGNYTNSLLNKSYAINAIEILKKKLSFVSYTSSSLWKEVSEPDKTHNGQMDVVLTLWRNKKINEGRF